MQGYRGAIGRTRTETVHVTDRRGALVAVQVTTAINAATDPELVERLHHDALNVAELDGGPLRIAVPVLYHDPVTSVMALVLGEAHRHREIEERIALLEQLRRDDAPVPAYAKDFAVVFGAAGLRSFLEQRARMRAAEAELEGKAREVEQLAGALLAARTELEQLRGAPREAESFDVSTDIEAEIAAESEIEAEIDASPSTDALTTQLTELPIAAAPARDGAADARDAPDGGDARDAGDAPDTEDTEDRTEPATAARCYADATGVHVVASVGAQIARGLRGALDVRLVLHRAPSYPVIALVLGPPEAMRAPATTELVVIALDVAAEQDRAALHELGKAFELTLELAIGGRLFRRCKLTAPLADNAAYIVHAAEDHLRGIASDGRPDYAPARDRVLGAGFDLLGIEHPERSEFRDDKLAQIATAQQLRRALAIARRFTRPAREDYLVCTRSFPLPRWHRLRRDVLTRAVAWGLWMGSELAQIAVSEGLARSRRDLVARLDRGFEDLRHDAAAFDIDADAAADNVAAIADEARVLGVDLRPVIPNGAGAIASDAVPVVSGSIGALPPRRPAGTWSTEDLLAQLDDTRGHREGQPPRVVAALALCHRADPRTAGAVIGAAMKMSRGEAVRVLAMAVKFGAAAKPALLEGMTSNKAFLRHGCALALALLRGDDATAAVIDLLVGEPTELWREIARAIGHIGPAALAPLAERVDRLGDQPGDRLGERARAAEPRIVWAMAHIGVRGGKAELAAMAGQHSVVAPIAAKALALLALAASDHIGERRGATVTRERDLTVNQAFSRQFFDTLEQDRADGASMQEMSTAVEP